MKKVLVIALAVILVVSAVCVLAACDNGETYTGECYYENTYSQETPKPKYGVKVDVTVKGGIIKSVKLYTDEETGWTRTSANQGNWTKHDEVEAQYDDWIKKTFVGKTVKEVMAYQATASSVSDLTVTTPNIAMSGATQSSARVIVAIQNALSKIPAAE